VAGLVEISAMKLHYEILLECFLWGLETFSRRDCGLILAGFRHTPGDHRLDKLLDRLREQGFVEQRGRGANATFTITDLGRQRVRVADPHPHWNRAWDGRWRVFSFDLPVIRRRDRIVLWRALRDRKIGLLQRSVWLWPHEIEPFLNEILQAHGIPECFCGFEAGRLFLCDNAEVVATAWNWKEIARQHGTYLNHDAIHPSSLSRAGDLAAVARLARIARDAYQYAFSFDPLLPRALWPKSYQGPAVEERRQNFHARLRRRVQELASIC
jgi:DNA-binding transcriptional regulator PaaX